MTRQVLITGGTGYMGRRLVPALLARGHRVRALVRSTSHSISRRGLPAGCEVVEGNALDAASLASVLRPADVLVHLVGTPKPAPWKAAQFEAVDLASIRASASAARAAGISHLIYVSVAHPAPVMRAYVDVRRRGEALVRESGVAHTLLRPWYVLGPSHRWPYALVPLYWVLERVPSTSDGARRLGLVTLAQMVRALVWSVETAGAGSRVLDVADIRRGHVALHSAEPASMTAAR